jgi:hypothetical protein
MPDILPGLRGPERGPAGVSAGGDIVVPRALKARRPLHHSGHGWRRRSRPI